jgi:hypothetical protein
MELIDYSSRRVGRKKAQPGGCAWEGEGLREQREVWQETEAQDELGDGVWGRCRSGGLGTTRPTSECFAYRFSVTWK